MPAQPRAYRAWALVGGVRRKPQLRAPRPIRTPDRAGRRAGNRNAHRGQSLFRLREREGRRLRPQDRAALARRRLRARAYRAEYEEADRRRQGVCAVRLRRHADFGRGFARLHAGQGAVLRRVHRRRGAARPVQSLHFQRARELLRRNREDRRTAGLDRGEEHRGVLPERRLRPGRTEGRAARHGQAQPEDLGDRHGGAQHHRGCRLRSRRSSRCSRTR